MRTWAQAEQSCLWQAKWRSNSILAMTKGQVPLLKACLHQMQTQHLFFLNPFLLFSQIEKDQKGQGLCIHPQSNISSFSTFLLKGRLIRAFPGPLFCPRCWILWGINGLVNLWMHSSQYAPNRWCVAPPLFFFLFFFSPLVFSSPLASDNLLPSAC